MAAKHLNGYERLVSTIEGSEVDCLAFMPITMMFAADQIGVKYGTYATDFRTLVEAQLHMAEKFDADHVSCISDPAREAGDCGSKVQFFEDQPPAIIENAVAIQDKATLATLNMPDPLADGRMFDRVKAAELFKKHVGGQKIIQGWVEGPIAMGADLRGLNTLMLDLIDDPVFTGDLFAFCTELALRFAKAQINAGADMIGIGDAAASLAGPKLYKELIWPYEKKVVDGIREMGGRVDLHICGRTQALLEPMGKLGCDIVDLDSLAPLSEARAQMGLNQVLLGNIDPVRILRNGSSENVYRAIEECHRQAGSRYVVSAGCEVPRDTPVENLNAMREYARSHH